MPGANHEIWAGGEVSILLFSSRPPNNQKTEKQVELRYALYPELNIFSRSVKTQDTGVTVLPNPCRGGASACRRRCVLPERADYPVSLGAEHDALAGGFLWNSEEHACIACLVNIESWNAPIENGWLALGEKRLGSV